MPTSKQAQDKEQAAKEQFLSIPAKRLQEKLLLIKDRVELSKRRWFWELLQNASDYNDSVSVRLVVTADKVVFQHNGSPFSITDVLNVISPDSDKDNVEKVGNENNIGKFGTGLVSTHILSAIMQVKGIYRNNDGNLFEFAFDLDRGCYDKKTDLINEMEKVRSGFIHNDQCEVTSCDGFNTSFSYILNRPLPMVPAMRPSDIDLDYLYSVLPYTLCFMEKVQTVVVEDRRNGCHNFSIRRKAQSDNTISFEIKHDDNVHTVDFAYFSYNDVSSAFCYVGNCVLPYPKNMAKMFCGLPLVGMENVGMPFILNSLEFKPSVERDGIAFSPSSNPENRSLLVDSVELYGKMLDYVEARQMDGAYNLAHMSRRYNGNSESNQQFYKVGVEHFVKQLSKHTVVRTQSGDFISFSQTRIPFKESKLDEKLYEYASFVSEKMLPQASDYKEWFEATDFSLFPEQKYTYKMLGEKIEQTGNVLAFGKSADVVTTWMKACLSYLKECNKYMFSEMKLLPNKLGELQVSDALFEDKELPNELKDIYNLLFEGDSHKIESELLDSSFDFLNVVNRVYDKERLSRIIDDKVAEIYAKNKGDVSSITLPLNKLYTWMTKSGLTKDQLQSWFKWYYPKRAGLIVDMLTETQREQALVIAQSGKMEVLATLASSNLTDDEFALLVANINKLPTALSYLSDNIDDQSFANLEEGNYGESVVFKKLQSLFPRQKGYAVTWASRDMNEPRYDFVVKKNGEAVCYCDAKTTKRGVANADSIPFFMRRSQWEFLQTIGTDIPYYIARVFIGDNNTVKFMRISNTKSVC